MSRYEANAKINLYLAITGKRNDGYHTLSSIMQSVSLCDVIDVELTGYRNGISVSCDADNIPIDKRNVVYKAAEAFFDLSGIAAGAKIDIKKWIPSQAGMGGGSADGAAVIRALDRLCGTDYSEDELRRLASRVGADVPFCLYGGCREVAGIGEIDLGSLPPPDCTYLIVKADECISTPVAYRSLDIKNVDLVESGHRDCGILRDSLLSGGKCFTNHMYNVFESVLPELAPKTSDIIDFMRERTQGALLCGSGSAVFAVTQNEKEALNLRDTVISKFGDLFTAICVPAQSGVKMLSERN